MTTLGTLGAEVDLSARPSVGGEDVEEDRGIGQALLAWNGYPVVPSDNVLKTMGQPYHVNT